MRPGGQSCGTKVREGEGGEGGLLLAKYPRFSWSRLPHPCALVTLSRDRRAAMGRTLGPPHAQVVTTEQMWDLVGEISAKSKALLQTTDAYVHNDRHVRLVTRPRKFAAPVAVSADLHFHKALTISAWVKASRGGPVSGLLLRKAPSRNPRVSCWAAAANGTFHYGDHDAGLPDTASSTTFHPLNRSRVAPQYGPWRQVCVKASCLLCGGFLGS